jgi:hypothetical protein
MSALHPSADPSFRRAPGVPIPGTVTRERRLEEIQAAFAEAVAEGDLAAAEGWLAVAAFVAAGSALGSETDGSRSGAEPGA